ncbi:phosphate acyltransferase [Ureaplasma urealyticum]|uniref:phosphate acyltransferase n=1 Tax=Ureaplasma urealyticum TaxID=2130 RepID=UPI00030A61BC|nr:phosphate acyltransferase [Ureaplasma urealyticum]
MLNVVNKLKIKLENLTKKPLKVLFIEQSLEIDKAKQILSQNSLINIVDLASFKTPEIISECENIWYELRKSKGESQKDAQLAISNDLNFAVCLSYLKKIDILIVGANLSSKTCFSSILKILKNPNGSIACSTMVMASEQELIFMSDCALNLTLNKDQMIDVAKHSYTIAKKYFEVLNNHAAYISYLSQNDVLYQNNDFDFIGPMQFDAVVDLRVRNKKIINSHQNHINHYVFDNISIANTIFKIYQTKLHYLTIGSYISNILTKVSVISRSASVDEIVATTYLLCVAFLVDLF